MSTQVKHRRGTQSEVDGFTPAVGEIIAVTDESELVLGNGASPGGVPIPKKSHTMLSFDTLADAVANGSLKNGYSLTVKERVTGQGGGATWDVVLASSVTPDTYRVVSCTGVPSLALVLRKNDEGKYVARAMGLVSDGTDQTAVMQFFDTIITDNSLVFDAGVYVMQGVLWTGRSNFSIEFTGKPVFKLANGANTFAFRLSVCSDFNIKGVLYADGNKANNLAGGSSGGASNGTISISGSSNNFTIDTIKVKNGWTNGVALDGCSDFTAELLQADDSARRGVTLNACSDFLVDKIKAKEATLNTSVYVLGCTNFDVGSVVASGARGSNAVLFEIGNTDFHVGSIITSDSFSGTKFEDNDRFSVDSVVSLGTTDSIGVTINGGDTIDIGSVVSRSSAAEGVAILSAEDAVARVSIGSITSALSASNGLIVQSNGANGISSINIGTFTGASNGDSQIKIDETNAGTLIASGDISIGEVKTTGTTNFDVEVKTTTDPLRGRPNIGKGLYTTNYSNPPTLTPDDTTPLVSSLLKYSDVFVTANTVATTVTRFDGWTGDNRSFYVLIQDGNTTFANGTGAGRIIVQGASVVTALGELWKATYVNSIWYMHKVS